MAWVGRDHSGGRLVNRAVNILTVKLYSLFCVSGLWSLIQDYSQTFLINIKIGLLPCYQQILCARGVCWCVMGVSVERSSWVCYLGNLLDL